MNNQIKYLFIVMFSMMVAAAPAVFARAEEGDAVAKICEPREAIAIYQAALRFKPNDGELMVKLAKAYEADEWFGRSVEMWESYLAQFPDGEHAAMARDHAATNHRWVGSALFLVGASAGMVEGHLLRAVQLNPGLLDAYVWLARFYQSQGRHDAEFLALNKADEIAAGNREVMDLRHDANAMIKKEGSAHALIRKGIAYYDEGKTGMALRAFRQAGEAKPGLPIVHYWLGRIESEQDQFARAVPEFRRLSMTDKNNYRYAFFLEQAQVMRGDPLSRIDTAKRAPNTFAGFESTPGALNRRESGAEFCAIPLIPKY